MSIGQDFYHSTETIQRSLSDKNCGALTATHLQTNNVGWRISDIFSLHCRLQWEQTPRRDVCCSRNCFPEAQLGASQELEKVCAKTNSCQDRASSGWLLSDHAAALINNQAHTGQEKWGILRLLSPKNHQEATSPQAHHLGREPSMMGALSL